MAKSLCLGHGQFVTVAFRKKRYVYVCSICKEPMESSSHDQRPPFETVYMNFAVGLSTRSTCRRLSVGCVIVSTDFRYVYGAGYNGGASGLDNDCESDVPGQCGHLHAEDNACVNCRADRQLPKIVICTHLPCAMCAKRLINLGGVQRVLYLNDYRIRDSLALFERAGIEYKQFTPEK